ncbi:MAG: hypothetical protein QOH81_2122 [Sphingomonadales bacterium]|jgi:hypothetical protein|nr:hypothetical protein [Sphingomonadales bacterium]
MDYEPGVKATRPKRPLAAALILVLVAFALGLAAMGWLLAHWHGGARFLGVVPAAPATQPAPGPALTVQPEPVQPAQAAPLDTQIPVTDPELVRRVNLMEQRLATLDVQSRAAVGNAGRAEALLVAFAARRALDRGVQLGYIEALLRDRFGATQPQAVATVLTAAHQPVMLQQLRTGFQDIKSHLAGGGPEQSWWTAFRTELGGLITIRREGTPSTMPSDRLHRAERALDAGQVEVALLEVLRLPGRDNAKDWIAQARRYVAARQALDTIETAALLEPPRTPQAPDASTSAAPAKR